MLTQAADSLAVDRAAAPPSHRSGAMVWWHALWGLAVLAAGAGLLAAFGGADPNPYIALGLGIAPCLLGVAVERVANQRVRALLLVVWASAGGAACVFAGGITGPLAPWILAPVAAAAVLGRSNLLAQAAALSLMAGSVAAIAQLAGIAPPRPAAQLDFWLGLVGLATTSVGLASGLLVSRAQATRRDRAFRTDVDSLAVLLADQPHLICVLSPDGRIVRAFGTAPQGLGEGVLKGKGLPHAAQYPEQAAVATAIAAANDRGAAQVSFSPQAALDRRLAVDLRRSSDGALIAVIRDDTAAFSREAALEAAKADAENLAAGKSRFLANMSHELRTPLNAIMGFSDIMRAKMFGDLPGRYVEYADLIYESGAHLLDLINDVLDMSKIEAQKFELIREDFDSRDPISGALRIVRLQADEAGVQLRGVLPAQPVYVNADRRALKQILLNLVSNALKFTPRGGSVVVTLTGHGDDLELTVADTGVGIAEQDLAKIGRPYEQVGANDKKTMGTGLGLSLVRAFAELHGGLMTIESRLGAGTAVTVRMPVVVTTPALELGGNVVAFSPQR